MIVPRATPGKAFDPLGPRKRRLFILGAGFSASAGVPMTGELLAAAMEQMGRENESFAPAIHDKVRRAFRLEGAPRYEQLSMSEVCTILAYHELCEARHNYNPWDRRFSPELLALRFAIAKVIAQRTPADLPGLYKAFVNQLRDDEFDGDVVVSFNWDCLLEVAMNECGKRWHYHGSQRGVRLLKMHGSINWRRADSEHRTPGSCNWVPMVSPDPDGVPDWSDEGLEGAGIETTADLLRWSDQWETAKPLGLDWEIDPLIVLPGYGKAFDIRPLAAFWSQPSYGGCMDTKGDVFVVGLSLARDDFIIQALFRDTLQHVGDDRRVAIINPDPRALDNYSFLVGRPNVSFLCHRFCDADIKLMEHSASDARWQQCVT